jgi:hypothetical protein
MKKTLLVIVSQEGQYDFVVRHWLADSEALTGEMIEWLHEACRYDYDDLSPEVRGFLWCEDFDGDFDMDEGEQAAKDFERGKALGRAWTTTDKSTITYADIDAVYTAMFCFY